LRQMSDVNYHFSFMFWWGCVVSGAKHVEAKDLGLSDEFWPETTAID
jgi:hypothetical protein